MSLTIRPACVGELGAVMTLIEDGRRAIAELGIEQWQNGYPDEAAMAEDIALGACCVAEDADGRLLGTLALRFGEDADYEESGISWLAPGLPYASVHRCAVAADAGKRGVMSSLLSQVETIARAQGAASLRADTHPGNVRMRGFLAKQGFTELAPFDLVTHSTPTDHRRIAYEKLL